MTLYEIELLNVYGEIEKIIPVALKTCPFCNNDPEIDYAVRGEKGDVFIIKCPQCRIEMKNSAKIISQEELVKMSAEEWNMRDGEK